MLSKELYRTYVQILKDELVPAMGCTEPIAIAYAGAVARKTLGPLPERVEVAVSRNIIKNVKSVVVPHTGGLRGIEAAAAAGIVAGDAAKELEVISHVEQEDIEAMGTFLKEVPCSVCEASSDLIFDIQITLYHGEDNASVRITDFHTNLVHVSRNGEILLAKEITGKEESALADKSTLTIEKIFAFAKEVDLADVREVLERQVRYNMVIAEEGLRGNYGANIGKVLLATYGDQDVKVRAKAMAAAGSDARMNGCELPVVINSGSGDDVPGAGDLESGNDPYQRRNRQTLRVLRCGRSRMWMWRRDRLPVWRRSERGRTCHCQRSCHCIRYDLRRSKSVLCSKDRVLRRCGNPRLLYVQERTAVYRRRRYREKRRGKYDPLCGQTGI